MTPFLLLSSGILLSVFQNHIGSQTNLTPLFGRPPVTFDMIRNAQKKRQLKELIMDAHYSKREIDLGGNDTYTVQQIYDAITGNHKQVDKNTSETIKALGRGFKNTVLDLPNWPKKG